MYKIRKLVMAKSHVKQGLLFDFGAMSGLTDWLIGVLHRFQRYFSHITATAHIFMYSLVFTSTRMGFWGVLLKDTPTKKILEDPVLLEPRASRLRVTDLTTEPRGTPLCFWTGVCKWEFVADSWDVNPPPPPTHTHKRISFNRAWLNDRTKYCQ